MVEEDLAVLVVDDGGAALDVGALLVPGDAGGAVDVQSHLYKQKSETVQGHLLCDVLPYRCLACRISNTRQQEREGVPSMTSLPPPKCVYGVWNIWPVNGGGSKV